MHKSLYAVPCMLSPAEHSKRAVLQYIVFLSKLAQDGVGMEMMGSRRTRENQYTKR